VFLARWTITVTITVLLRNVKFMGTLTKWVKFHLHFINRIFKIFTGEQRLAKLLKLFGEIDHCESCIRMIIFFFELYL